MKSNRRGAQIGGRIWIPYCESHIGVLYLAQTPESGRFNKNIIYDLPARTFSAVGIGIFQLRNYFINISVVWVPVFFFGLAMSGEPEDHKLEHVM